MSSAQNDESRTGKGAAPDTAPTTETHPDSTGTVAVLDVGVWGDEVDETADLEPRGDLLAEARTDLGVTPANSPDWSWCADSTDLDLVGPASATSYSGIAGKRGDGSDWFVRWPLETPVEVHTSKPKRVITRIPGAKRQRTLLCDNPIDAARCRAEGNYDDDVLWFNGVKNGWRSGSPRAADEIRDIATPEIELFAPHALDSYDEWHAWDLLRKALPSKATVWVTCGDECIKATEFFKRANRPLTETERRAAEARETVLATPFAGKLPPAVIAARALGEGCSYMSESGNRLLTDLAARAAVAAFDARCARGPGGLWAYDRGVWTPVGGTDDEFGAGGQLAGVVAALLMDDYSQRNLATIESYLSNLYDLPALHARPDTDGWEGYLNFRNGLYDWRAGTFGPHDHNVLSTWQMPVDYDETATCPRFLRFLSEALPADMLEPDEHGIAPWQEDFGYFLVPGNPLQRAFLLRGGGRNGKGVYMDVLKGIVGPTATSALSLEDLTDSDRKFRLIGLLRSALNIAGEVDPKFLRSTASFKQLTGGDEMTLEPKFKKSFPFKPWTTLLFSANNDFAAVDRSVAYFERWEVRSFPHFVRPEDRIAGLAASIVADEATGIARLAVEGLRSVMARGTFNTVASSEVVKDTFRKHSDHLVRFVDERLDYDVTAKASRAEVASDYEQWCEDERIKPLPVSQLYATVKDYGRTAHSIEVEDTKSSGARWFSGVRVVKS